MADKPKSPATPPRKRQIVILADFPYPWGNDIGAEVKAMLASRPKKVTWAPSTKDFEAVMRADVISLDGTPVPLRVCKDFDSFAAILLSFPVGSLGRVNVITHSNTNRIALGGTVDRKGVVKFGGMDDSVNFKRSELLASESITATAVAFLNQRLDTNVLAPDPEDDGVSLRDDLRSRFDPQKGEIVFYGCEGGAGVGFLIFLELSQTLGVNVRGFEEEIEFIEIPNDIQVSPPAVKTRARTRYQEKTPVGQRTTKFSPGFLHLIPDVATGRPSSLKP